MTTAKLLDGFPALPTFAEYTGVLLDPSAFPDSTRHVQRLETHISCVLLTDRFAYKLKKPVRFDFVDYSTIDKRKAACDAEVMLNKRLARGVYLDVVPVTLDLRRGRISINGRGQVIDWAVKMRRLPDDRALQAILQRGPLPERDLLRLARWLAEFYDRLPPVWLRTETYRSRVEHHVLDNRTVLLNSVASQRDAILRTHISQLALLRLQAEVLNNRVRDGRIVDGHGDLRPAHIYLKQQPLAVDCLEFSRELREIDVLDELCFLAMECERLGAGYVGQKILEQYSRASGDRPPPVLSHFYKAYRACVRAKVGALRATQVGDQSKGACWDDVLQYLQIADQYARQIAPPFLLIVGGISGSGKSTLAAQLAEQLGVEHFQTDQIRQQLFGRSLEPAAMAEANYVPERRDAVYAEMLRRAELQLQQGISVVVDGTFLRPQWRELALTVARRQFAAPLMIRCDCPPQIAGQRMNGRGATATWSEAGPSIVQYQQNERQWTEMQDGVDTSGSLQLALEEVFRKLNKLLF